MFVTIFLIPTEKETDYTRVLTLGNKTNIKAAKKCFFFLCHFSRSCAG